MDAEQPLGRLPSHRVCDEGAHVAALGDVARVAEAVHQLRPGLRDTAGCRRSPERLLPWRVQPRLVGHSDPASFAALRGQRSRTTGRTSTTSGAWRRNATPVTNVLQISTACARQSRRSRPASPAARLDSPSQLSGPVVLARRDESEAKLGSWADRERPPPEPSRLPAVPVWRSSSPSTDSTEAPSSTWSSDRSRLLDLRVFMGVCPGTSLPPQRREGGRASAATRKNAFPAT